MDLIFSARAFVGSAFLMVNRLKRVSSPRLLMSSFILCIISYFAMLLAKSIYLSMVVRFICGAAWALISCSLYRLFALVESFE